MARIHLGLSVWATVLFLAEGVIGLASPGNPALFLWHFAGGVLTALLIVALHTIVMFHFIGSGAELKDLALLLGRDASIIEGVRRIKKAVFPVATLAMLATIAAEVAGGAVHSGAAPPFVHLLLVASALVLNLYAFVVEHATLRENERLIEASTRKIRDLMTPEFIRQMGKP